MISDSILPATDITWLIFAICQVGLFLLFIRPVKNDVGSLPRTVAAISLLFVVWRLIELWHLDFVYDFMMKVALLTLCLMLWKGSRFSLSLYFSCIYALCLEIGKVVCVDVCLQPFYDRLVTLSSLAITCIWMVLVLAIAAVMVWLVSHWVFTEGTDKLTWKQCFFILLPMIPYILVRNSSYAYNNADPTLYRNVVVTLLLLSACTIAMIVANAHNLSDQLARNELLVMQAMLREQHQQYLDEKVAADAVNRQYHDLKHYLHVLEAIRDSDRSSSEVSDELDSFISSFSTEIAPYSTSVETGNPYVDIVLSDKKNECAEKGLRPVFYVDGTRLGFMSGFDISAVFGNILDNAIEAAQKVDDPACKDIDLSVLYQNDLAVIRCTNSFTGAIHRDGELPASTKDDDGPHGYGMRNIRRIVAKYGGTCSWKADGQEFTITALLPIPHADAETATDGSR